MVVYATLSALGRPEYEDGAPHTTNARSATGFAGHKLASLGHLMRQQNSCHEFVQHDHLVIHELPLW